MKNQPAEPSALTIWFNRQRRAWWRNQWWVVLALLAFLVGAWLLTPLGWAAFVDRYYGYNRSTAGLWIVRALANYAPLVYVVILLSVSWIVAWLGRMYKVPGDLLVATSPPECNRAFVAVFRKDVYIFFGSVVILPVMVLFVTIGGSGAAVMSLLISPAILGPLILMCELAIYLQAVKRKFHLLVHILMPLVFLTITLAVVPLLFHRLVQVLGSDSPTADIAQFMLPVAFGVCCLAVARHVFLRSYAPATGRDAWLEG